MNQRCTVLGTTLLALSLFASGCGETDSSASSAGKIAKVGNALMKAVDVIFDNESTKLQSTNVQGALEELHTDLEGVKDKLNMAPAGCPDGMAKGFDSCVDQHLQLTAGLYTYDFAEKHCRDQGKALCDSYELFVACKDTKIDDYAEGNYWEWSRNIINGGNAVLMLYNKTTAYGCYHSSYADIQTYVAQFRCCSRP